MKNTLIVLFLVFATTLVKAQNMPLSYTFGGKYNDRYKFSNLMAMTSDGNGGYLLVRAYYTGLILKPKGYYIERYDKDLSLLSEYNFKIKDLDFVDAFVNNGQLNLLFLQYNQRSESYEYVVQSSPLENMGFSPKTILSIPSIRVDSPLEKNYYNRNFSSGFTTTVLFNKDKSAFAISAHFKKKSDNQHFIYLFDNSLNKLITHDFSSQIEEKNYAFENIEVSKDKSVIYLIGKAYFKKKRFAITERKFQYELVRITTNNDEKTQTFDGPGKFSEALIPILTGNRLLCVGFYADRKDNRYNGLTYVDIDPESLEIRTKKYDPFSQQFMKDKFGKEMDKEIKNLVFKNVSLTSDGSILFNAEEEFVTDSYQSDGGGNRIKINRYHYNDIVSAKLDSSGNMVWARNINKSEVTQGDGAYASYSTYTNGDTTYFFISTAAENPQQLGVDRIVFRQGYTHNRNVFAIELDALGHMSWEKVIDDKEARLPLMVSLPYIDYINDTVLFYAKRGNKKQLVKVSVGS
ncbi:hypothetical protein K8352_09015 [Flavobacteriaceae bacterium F89]|uniref:Uncharacterized protein n=1 Tax=Cerina litoralis TaxID=2874477 RepID=A0AAE3JR32_9FLAO|nr:hypothetical protein [Cerina litoralis]MCG2460888.1 hypothetical protein [Cerina litoralis]